MNKNTKQLKATDFDEYLKQQLRDPQFKALYELSRQQLEVSYAINQLRKKQKISQAQLAKKLATSQSNIARLEAGKQNFTIQMLSKIAKALDKKLVVYFQ